MPWSGSAGVQTFQRATGVFSGATCWAQTDSAVRGIRSDDHDYHDQDIADGISACLNRLGGNAVAANIPMGGFKLTNLAPGTQPTDSVRYDQLPAGVLTTRGDLMYYGATGLARLPKGTSGQVLTQGANDPQWSAIPFPVYGTAANYNIGNSGATVPLFTGLNNTWSATNVFLSTNGTTSVIASAGNNTTLVPLQVSHGALDPFPTPYYLVQFATASGSPITPTVPLGEVGSIRGQVGVPIITYNDTSDYRLKDNIRDLDNVGAVFDAIRPRRFNWRGVPDLDFTGFVAHELQEALPEAASGEKDAVKDGKIKPQTTIPSRLIPYLVAEVKSLRARVADLEANAAT